MQLTHLIIEQIRALERLDLDLSAGAGIPRRRAVFLGANGAGKTTILDVLGHVFAKLGIGDYRNAELRAGDVRNTQLPALEHEESPRRGHIEVQATLSSEELRGIAPYYRDAPSHGSLHMDIGGEELSQLLSETAQAPTSPFASAAGLAITRARPPCVLLPADRGVLEQEDDLLLKEVTEFEPREGCLSRSRARFKPLAARLAMAFAGDLRADPRRITSRMWKVLAKYFPELPRPIGVEGLHLRFENQEGAVLPLRALSDGERALLLLFGELSLRAPQDGVVLIDEVEQHLHPRWQRIVSEALSSLLPSAQFILTTQSPYLAASVPDDVVELGDWKRHGE